MVKVAISLKDAVGNTIKRLGYRFEELEEDVTEFRYEGRDPLVVICRHESSSRKPSLTVHYPGNPSMEVMGGKPETLGYSYPSLGSSIYREILKIEDPIEKVFEATHHGPTLDVPIIFAEIGSSPEMWNNEELVEKFVRAILRALDNTPTCEDIVVGFGGPHYARDFSSFAEKSCLGHVISKYYVKEVSVDVIRQAVLKSVDRTKKVLLNDLNKTVRSRIEASLSDLDLVLELI